MAATIGAAADTQDIRIGWLGAWNEDATNVVTVDGAAADADVEQFLDDVDAVSLAGMPNVNLSARRNVTGLSSTPAFQTPSSQVNNMLILSFSQAHPLNAALTITKSFQLRAPNSAVIGTDGALVIASVVGDRSSFDENLRGVIDFLEDNLSYEAIDGSITNGGWTFNVAKSAYVASPAVIDGQ